MKIRLLAKCLMLTALLMPWTVAQAEDIDIYTANSSGAASNLLLVIDNSGSWNASSSTALCAPGSIHSTLANSAGGVEVCGIWKAIDIIKNTPSLLGQLNMGLMLFSQGSTQGGTFKYPAPSPAPSALPNMNAGNITTLQSVLTGLASSGPSSSTANGTDVGGSMQEAYAFYTGKTGMSGVTYPGVSTAACGKNFVVMIGISRVSSDPGDANSGNVFNQLVTAGASAAQQNYIRIAPPNDKYSSSSKYWGDEWTRFNKDNFGITTYTITLVDSSNPNPDYEAFMESMALRSGGKALKININDINAFVQALLSIFNEVQAVNSVFAAASLPISVNAQGTFLNQVYFGTFRPDAGGLPRWSGNLKQYQFQLATTGTTRRLFLADATGAEALNAAGTGFFSPDAVSFWTSKNTGALPDSIDPLGTNTLFNPPHKGGFFVFNPQGSGEGFDLPDGEIVEKGGVAQQLRLKNLFVDYGVNAGTGTNLRRLYTCTTGCTSASSLSAYPFSPENTGITNALLGSGVTGTPILSIVRTGKTALVTLASSMSPVLAGGQSVNITGSSFPEFVGQFPVAASPAPSATSFTITIKETPPTPATGAYTASVAGSANSLSSVVRNGATTALATTVVATHSYVVGQTVTISGAGTGYNGTPTVTSVPSANTFQFNITPGPSTAGGGGTATVGATVRTIAAGGIVRAAPTGPAPGYTARVTITLTANHSFAVNNTVTIAGASPTAYNGAWKITALGGTTGCPGSPANRVFCFDIPTTPGAATSPATASTTSASVSIASLTRTAACTAPTASSPNATVTATTSTAHGFVTGAVVTISGTGSSDEDAYKGAQTIVSVPSSTTFTYNVTTQPGCSDTASGMTASVGVDRDKMIRWVRGEDNLGDELTPGVSTINVRGSIHGDVLHSRPAVVNYGGTTGVVVFYGSNDGVFRAVNGNQTAAIGSVNAGGELWGFVAPEFFGRLQRQYLNSPVVKLSATSTALLPTPQPKDYYFDGGIGVYQDVTSGKVILFLSARRGGRLIYALDVTDPTAPKFLWKRSSADGGFSELGQTWSTPKVALVKGYVDGSNNPIPVLIFGAGYDPAEDAEPPTARSMGRGIFMLDATNGNIVWSARYDATTANTSSCIGNPCLLQDMAYPIASDATLIDRDTTDGNGYVDRIYIPDLGGNVWRVDLQPSAGATATPAFGPATWKVTKLASVGGAATDTTRRKIFFPPDVVSTNLFDAVVFATGDREHPTLAQAATNIVNRFYMIKDVIGNDASATTVTDNTSSTANNAPTGLFNASPVLPTTASSTPSQPGPTFDPSNAAYSGFYITLRNVVAQQTGTGTQYGPTLETGEKGVNAPTTIGGTVFFGTNTPIVPSALSCQPNLGTARGYAVNFITGELNFNVFPGGGLPPSPVSGLVNINGETVPFIIGGVPPPGSKAPPSTSAIGSTEASIPIAPVRSRRYWYRDIGNR